MRYNAGVSSAALTTTFSALPDAFRIDGPDLAIDLPGGHVRFTTAPSGDLALQDPPSLAPPAATALAERIGIGWDRWAQDRQVHAPDVRRIAAEDELRPLSSDHDGQATTLAGVACTVRVADCLPIALVAPEGVAMLHGGWRPLAGGVVGHGVEALRALGASEIRAAVGPGAGVCCFEAGEEVHAAFASLGPDVRRGDHADLKAVARAQLQAAGVDEIHDVGVCTICAPPDALFSHRRDRGVTGRQVGVAWRS
jgi:YfiH family protein